MRHPDTSKFQPSKRATAAPAELGKAGKALWKAVQADTAIDDPGGRAHLLTACRSEDDIARMRAAVAREGDTILDRFSQPQPHPLLGSIRGSETIRRQSLRELHLDIEPLKDRPGRPSGR